MRPKTIFCDIDGTLIKHDPPNIAFKSDYKMILLEGTIEKLIEWDRLGYNIILTTGRKESLREITKRQLEDVGIFYDQLIMGVGGGERCLINDMKPDGAITAEAINLPRNAGIGNIKNVSKSCIIFSISVFTQDKIFVLKEFLDTFKIHFSECDYYIGINYGSIPEVEDVISEYNLNAVISRVKDESMYCGSDASAYQAALKILKDSKKSYDIYWFCHTKGAVNHRPYERHLYISELFSKRLEIESIFNKHPYLGSYALRGVSRSAAGVDWSKYDKDHDVDICKNNITKQLPYTHVNWSYIETMYAINGKSVETFLNLTSENFYNNKINEPCYFETVFPWIVSRLGYFPYVKYQECFFRENNLLQKTKNWIIENDLLYLIDYINI